VQLETGEEGRRAVAGRCRMRLSFALHEPDRRDTRYHQGMLKNAPIVPYIPATDVARARRFYEDKVGLVPREETAGGVVYECGDRSWIFLYPSAGAGTSKASQAFWQVDDLEAEMAELKARGVVFEEYDMPGLKTVNGIVTAGGARAAWFKDSEGNILAVIQTLRAEGA
jgi:predicted enzyme related to lactoylglutathione lyase